MKYKQWNPITRILLKFIPDLSDYFRTISLKPTLKKL